jgi:hypothetical protein
MRYEETEAGRVNRDASEAGSFWTYEALQERWVETVQLYDRLPDRERSWLSVRAHWPEIMRYPWRLGIDGEHDEQPADPPETRPLSLTRADVARMTEASEWLLLVPEDDRRIVAAALRYLAHGAQSVPWTKLRERLGETRTTGALRMRYERAVAVATMRLNGVPEAQALALARRDRGAARGDR